MEHCVISTPGCCDHSEWWRGAETTSTIPSMGLVLMHEIKRGAAEGSMYHSRAEKRSWKRFVTQDLFPLG